MFKVGDIVYVEGLYDSVFKAKILENVDENNFKIYIYDTWSTMMYPKKKCFTTPDALYDYKVKENRKLIRKYYSAIHTTEDLIKFMFTHTVCPCEEYTDWEARTAVIEWVKDNLAFELEED